MQEMAELITLHFVLVEAELYMQAIQAQAFVQAIYTIEHQWQLVAFCKSNFICIDLSYN